MAITQSAIRNSNGITFTYVTDSSADWTSVPNSTYFKDLTDGLIHYKNSTGTILEIFSNGGTAGDANRLIFDAKINQVGGITKGQAVYVNGADGTNILIGKADFSVEPTSSKTLGLLISSGNNNAQRQVVAEGLLKGTGSEPLDTSAGAPGDPIWLGDDGNLIYGLSNKPNAPNHLVFIGVVVESNPIVGEIFVKVQNGPELGELHNVDLISNPPTDGQVLSYDAITDLWVPATIPGATPSGTQLLSGGASWSGTGMVFNVSALTYTIDGDYYSSVAQNVTLAAGDPSNPRFDAIVVDATGTVSVITGTPSANPIVPSIPGTQVLIQYVLVAAGATTPSITNEFVYTDGSTPNWTPGSNLLTFFDPLSTTPTPFQGTECTYITAPSANTSVFLKYTKPSGSILRSSFPFLSFRIQVLPASSGRAMYVRLYNGSTYINAVSATSWGYSSTAVGVWQLVVIPLAAFGNNAITTVTEIRFLAQGTVATSTPFAFDDIKFQSGYGPQSNVATIDILDSGTVIGATAKLNFIDGANTTAVVTQDIPNNKIDVKIDTTGVVTSVTGTSPIASSGGATPAISMPAANGSTDGYLTSSDYSNFNNKIGGSGTLNYLPKFSPNGSTLANSLIFDNGTTVGIAGLNFVGSGKKVWIYNSTSESTIYSENSNTLAIESFGIRSITSGVRSAGTNYGAFLEVFGSTLENIGIKILASSGLNNYAAQLQDGTQGIGKFLKSVTTDGKANWANITAADVSGVVDTTGGTANYLSKFTDANTIEESLIRDDGTTIGIGVAPNANNFVLISNTVKSVGLLSQTSFNSGIGLYGQGLSGTGDLTGVYGLSNSATATTNTGVHGKALNTGTTNIGITGEAIGGTNNYCAKLIDGTEASGKFLKSATADGKANWGDVFNQIIQGQGTSVTPRNIINFQGPGVTVSDLPVLGKTVVSILYEIPLNNVIKVNSIADLPAPSGGTITLTANTVYEFNTGSFNIGTNYLTISDGTIIEGQSSFNTTLIYTGTGGAIRGTDVSFAARQIAFASPAGRVLDFTNVAQTKNISLQNCVISSQTSASIITGYNIVFMSQTRFVSCVGGINLVNNLGIAFELVVFNTTNSGTYITLTPTATTTAKFQNCDLEINTGNTGINVTSTAIASGIISGCDFKGTAAVASRLTGVNGNTAGWNIIYNSNIGIAGLQFVDIEISTVTNTALGNTAGTYLDTGVKSYALPIASYDSLATVMEGRITALMTNAVAVQSGVYDVTTAAIVGGLGTGVSGTNVAVPSNYIAITPNREYTGYYVKPTGAATRLSLKLTLKIY